MVLLVGSRKSILKNKKVRSQITKRLNDYRKKYKAQLKAAAEGGRSTKKRSPSIADRIFKKRKVLTRTKAEAETKTEKLINEEYKKRAGKMLRNKGRECAASPPTAPPAWGATVARAPTGAPSNRPAVR